ARSCAPLVRGHVDRLRPGVTRGWPPPRRGRPVPDQVPGGRRRGTPARRRIVRRRLSSFGVMFVPNHVRVAGELVRVCRSKGRIGLANWTPGGFIGRLFAVVGRYAPPPAELTPPARWGSDEYLGQLFGSSASSIRTTRRYFVFRYRSAEHWIDVFRTWYGPVTKAFTR